MPQVLKEEIRQRILQAAAEVFAEQGFERATIAVIAERAGLGAATLYRYYAGKDELFAAVVPPALEHKFGKLLARRVEALGAQLDSTEAEEMLAFWIEHRLAVVILLNGRFGDTFVNKLVELTSSQLNVALDAPTWFVMRRIFENTRAMLASILERHSRERDVRTAIEAFWSYQIAGLRAFAKHVR